MLFMKTALLPELILYGKLPEYNIAKNIIENGDTQALSELISFCQQHSLSGSCWKNLISWLIINDENAFSTSVERRPSAKGTVCEFGKHDLNILYDLFNADFLSFIGCVNGKLAASLNHFTADAKTGFVSDADIKACRLAEKLDGASDEKDFFRIVTGFYESCGVGALGLNMAFCLSEENGKTLIPLNGFEHIVLDDLWGYETQKAALVSNTEAFLNGKCANHVLMFGDSGTGKSTCMKALINQYYKSGLRVIEIYKHQFKYMYALLDKLKDRNYRFVLYMDDLSFEDFEIEYKYLKSIMEGGLGPKPENVLIYATSNRRHLIKENWSDRNDSDDLHSSDTVQEKTSLADRFGLSICFTKPVQHEYDQIVLHLAKKNSITVPEDELLRKARTWGIRHGGLSGRIAQQFINSILGA